MTEDDEPAEESTPARQAADALVDRLSTDLPERKLSNRQIALSYDTLGLLSLVASGKADGFQRIRDNLVEIASLFPEQLTKEKDEAILDVLLFGLTDAGAHGITVDEPNDGRHKPNWRSRS